jgi:hypothetical protein
VFLKVLKVWMLFLPMLLISDAVFLWVAVRNGLTVDAIVDGWLYYLLVVLGYHLYISAFWCMARLGEILIES